MPAFSVSLSWQIKTAAQAFEHPGSARDQRGAVRL